MSVNEQIRALEARVAALEDQSARPRPELLKGREALRAQESEQLAEQGLTPDTAPPVETDADEKGHKKK